MSHNVVSSIEVLRDKLNQTIKKGYNNVEVYTLSTELDHLITQYYKSK